MRVHKDRQGVTWWGLRGALNEMWCLCSTISTSVISHPLIYDLWNVEKSHIWCILYNLFHHTFPINVILKNIPQKINCSYKVETYSYFDSPWRKCWCKHLSSCLLPMYTNSWSDKEAKSTLAKCKERSLATLSVADETCVCFICPPQLDGSYVSYV